MKAVVTGAGGFIGSNLVSHLLKEGYEVIAISESSPPSSVQESKKCHYIKKNFMDVEWGEIGKADVLFHYASITDTLIEDRKRMFEVNVHAAEDLFKKALNSCCNNIVYASSMAVYGNTPLPLTEFKRVRPLNAYGQSKAALEERAVLLSEESPQSHIIGLRYSNVYGPSESGKGKMASMIYQFAMQMQKGNPRLFEFGEQQRDFLYVRDAVRAAILASKSFYSGVVNCGSGKGTTFNQLVSYLNEVMGTSRQPEYIPNPNRQGYQSNVVLDMSLAKKVLGFNPKFSIKEGIKEYYSLGF